MKTKIFLFTVYLLFSFMLPGCWDYVEYEDLAELGIMGLDVDPQSENLTVTVQYPSIRKTKGGGAAGGEAVTPQWITHSVTNKTVFGALTKLEEIIPSRIFFGYIKTVVVGEEAAKNNIMEIIDIFDRSPVVRTSAYLVITEGKAEDLIKTMSPSQRASGEKVDRLIGGLEYAGTGYRVTINDFLEMLAIGGWEATAPRIIYVTAKETNNVEEGQKDNGETKSKGNTEIKGDKLNEGSVPGHIDPYLESTGVMRAGGMAAFQGDKFVGWLNDRESRGLGFIRGKKLRAYEVSEPVVGTGLEAFFYRLLGTNTKIKVHIENNQPVITVNIKVIADLRKYHRNEGTDYLSLEEKRHLEQELAESIRADIDAALRRGQKELKTDIFGFGFAIFRTDPKLWQQEYAVKWADIYPDIPVHVNVEAKVINTGVNIRKLFIK